MSRTNALGQLTDVWEIKAADASTVAVSFPNQALAAGYQTSYQYDTLNNLTKVIQGTQPNRNFTYSSLSRLKTAANPESGTIGYVYDDGGNLTKKTDARTVETNYVYDALNRVTQRSYNDGITPTVSYTYDDKVNAKGKLTKVSSSVSTTEYAAFDIVGRVTNHRQTTDGQIYDTGYVYNLSGALIEETYPSGRVVKNTLDADGMLQQVQSKKANDTFRNYANSFNYTAAGAVSSVRLGNGRWENTTFNSRLQPIQIGLGSSATDQGLLKLDYQYGTLNWDGTVLAGTNNGNVAKQTITVPSVGSTTGFTATQYYAYDELNRIKTASETLTQNGQTTNGWTQGFTYDRYGNRRFDTANTTTLPQNCATAVCNPTIDPNTNKLIGYTFDAAGNTTFDAQSRTFTYDAENKQTKVKNSNNITVGEYFYDGDGKRVKKVVPGTGETTIFVYDASGKMVAEYSTTVAPQAQAKISYLTSDDLGSPRITTDAVGKVFSRRDFLPFGEEITSTQTAQRNVNLNYGEDGIRQKFTSYERDNETDLDFAKARYHNSSVGRFTSPDDFVNDTHVSDSQSWNLYVYVRNNPLRLTDPTGKEIVKKNGKVDFKPAKDPKLRDQFKKVDLATKTRTVGNGENQQTRKVVVSGGFTAGTITSKTNGTEVKINALQSTGDLKVTETNEKGEVTFEGTVSEYEAYSGDSEYNGANNVSNCHGTTFANGEVWIVNGDVEKLMRAEGYDVDNSSNTATNGAVGLFSFSEESNLTDPRHSVMVIGNNPTQVRSKSGIFPEQKTTPGDSWTNTSEKRKTDKLLYYSKKATK